MKRSEMVEELAKYLKENDQHVGFTDDLALIVAENALKGAEKAGMLPPRHGDYSDSLDKYPRGYEWEEEDEKKHSL